MAGRRLLVIVTVIGGLALAIASLAYAQQIFVGGGGRFRFNGHFATPEDFDGSFLYCRGFYRSVRGEAGGQGWSTDYPGADNNFSIRLSELTRVSVKWDPTRQPIHVVVRLNDPALNRCPMLFMEDVGTIQFSEGEIQGLRDYLLKGGFLWVDDFWGSVAWDRWVAELQRVLPSGEFPIIEVPLSHPIMHTVYDVTDYLQVSSINFWYRSEGSVSERGPDSAQVHFRGIEDSRKRLMVLMTHNTDVSDTWEREGENKEYFSLFSPRGYAIGVNVVVYALTH
jgi:hypothetical protein